MTLREIEISLNNIQGDLATADYPCTRKQDGRACTQQHAGKFDKEGRPVFYFGLGCKVVETFCDSCTAYWLVAVARNAVIAMMRHSR